MIDGKQIKDNSIAAAKLLSSFVATLIKSDGSVSMAAALNMGSNRITNLAAPTSDTDAARLADVYSLAWKDKVVCASTTNLTLTGAASAMDGITPAVGDRVLVRAQTTQSANGIYIVLTEWLVRASVIA